MRHSGIAQGKGGADALIQQVSGKHHVKIRHRDTGFLRQLSQCQLLHLFFCLLPGFLTEVGVPAFDIEGMGQWTFHFLFSGNICPCGDDRRLIQYKALSSPFLTCHDSTFLNLFSIVCAAVARNIQMLYNQKKKRRRGNGICSPTGTGTRFTQN